MKGLHSLFGNSPSVQTERERLVLDALPQETYAIGDVHGCYGKLLELEQKIIAQSGAPPGQKLIVMLGDYVDRGPDSARVINHLMAPPPDGFARICLMGNHEQVMQAFLQSPAGNGEWLEFGGRETLASYGVPMDSADGDGLDNPAFLTHLASAIPEPHKAFLADLPMMLVTPDFVFVHAGIRPGIALDAQTNRDLAWIRHDFLNAPELGIPQRVVHGHTPGSEPVISPARIGIDTAACMGGVLTALRIGASGKITFISA